MGVNVVKDAIDLGIVTTNGDAMLTFYRDVLGFRHEGDIHMEHVGIKTMHRLWFGNSLIKIVVPVKDPNRPAAPDGITGGTGYRYWTMTINNLDAVLDAVAAAGHKVVWPEERCAPASSSPWSRTPTAIGSSSSSLRNQHRHRSELPHTHGVPQCP